MTEGLLMQKAYLLLKNGRIFEGTALGAQCKTTGEIVFTTAMTGYCETLTDPSYYGQIVIQTFPLIGNYGIMKEDFESKKSYVKGYIVRDACDAPSNFRCGGDLDSFLKDQGIPGICGIDTRELTRIIREAGTMNGCIYYDVSDAENAKKEADDYSIKQSVESTTVSEKYTVGSDSAKHNVVLFDFGAKRNIERSLVKRGCRVTVVPALTSADDIAQMSPDGIMLSNGPGDPADNPEIIANIKKMCAMNIPMFGICLGHQMLALANGASTTKLKYGHRGANQPVKCLGTGRVYVSSQNHGYAVVNDSLPANATLSYINVNDGTCEGVDYTDTKAFSVQFHPEACGGPHDTEFLFDKFIAMMEEK